ncbi:Kinesin-like protein KIF9, partial [Eufriesea mexicana]
MTDNCEHANINEKNVKIFIRILPLEEPCESCAKIDSEHKKIFIRCLQEMQPNRIAISRKSSYWCFRADEIFSDTSQEEIYRVTAKDLVSKILGGVSCVVIGYGQTGSGKSFTITGLRNNWEHRGLVVRLLSHMFAEKANRKKVSRIEYHVSFIELHGKEAKDLLSSGTDNNKVRINEREPFKDISVVCVNSEEEGLKKIFEGEFRRSITKGSTYPESHLATSVITIHVSNTSLITSWSTVAAAKIHIVETAGTGTVGRNNCSKTAMDTGLGNLMKTELEQFFSYVGNSGSSAINMIRSNNLLKVLGNTFPISTVIRFISHIRITKEDLDITLSTLRFTLKIAKLKPLRIKEDVKYRADLLVHRLQNEVSALKKELMLNDMFLHQEALVNISKSRAEQINRSILNFLNDKISDFTLFNVSQAQVLLKNIKDLYNRLTAKELEVEKLKETYENLVKSVTEVGLSERLPKGSMLSTDDQVNNRKRVKRLSQVLLEAEESKRAIGKEVGILNKSTIGLTLGPYINEINLDERLKQSKRSTMSKQILKIDSQSMMTVRQLFQSFLREELEFTKLKKKFDENKKVLATVRQRFTNMIDNYFQAKRNLDDARDKLTKYRQTRYVLELDSWDGREAICEIEKTIERDISCYQKVLANLENEVNEVQYEISTLVNRDFEMGSKLESGFCEYCKRNAFLLHYTEKSMKALLAPEKESLEIIRSKYNKFQRAMLRKTQEIEKTKKVRFD